ncbi:MAG: hypothetical protein ABEJ93_04925 [Candidatus Nanohalobium sp.]
MSFVDTYRPGSSPFSSPSSGSEARNTGVKALSVAVVLTASGVLGRVALQHIPSVETVLPVALALGFYAGGKKGLVSGVSGFYATNFLVWGGQGPWTFFQCLGAGLAALSAGFIGKRNSGRLAYFFSLGVGALIYEIVVNVGSLFFSGVGLFSTPFYLAAAVPFVLTHFASTLGFGVSLYGFDRTLRSVYGTGKS